MRRKCAPQKTLKMRYLVGVNGPFRKKNSKLCSENVHDHVDSRFVFKFQIVRRGVGETIRCFADRKKVREVRFFSAPLCARSAEGAKNVKESVPRDPMSPCKISSQSVQFVRVIPENVIVHKYSICLRDIIIVGC